MKKPYFKDGSWNCVCPICGREVKSDQMRKRWDGVYVCKDDLDPRHPQDFIRSVAEDTSVPFVYSEPADTFVLACSNNSSVAGVAVAGCAIAGMEGSIPISGTNDGSL